MAKRRGRVGVVLAVGLLCAVLVGALAWFAYDLGNKGPLPPIVPEWDRCVATTPQHTVAVSSDQAHYASIIAGVALRRGLPSRAVTIALATAYQESGIANLDYGDRDSVGIFQQRPSQGWGTEKQLMDPYYATNAFYDELVKVPGWRTKDINDAAQAVQRSGVPNGYRRHVPNATALASALTGLVPGGWTCLDRASDSQGRAALSTFLNKTLGSRVGVETSGSALHVAAASEPAAWAAAHLIVANYARYGVTKVSVAGRTWQRSAGRLPTWASGAPNASGSVIVNFG